jgi:hypothetical protein
MKKILLAFVAVSFAATSFSQQILLEQDWQGFANGGEIGIVDVADDAEDGDWISFDSDVLPDANARPGNWYGAVSLDYFPTTEIIDTNFVMASSSWMEGFVPGNRNWLISPEVTIVDGAILSWESGLFQTPRYADGYSVWISPDASVGSLEDDFTDKLWTQAQMVENVSWNETYYPGIDYASCAAPAGADEEACWFPEMYGDGTGTTGYRHAADHTLTDYIGTDPDDAAPTSYRGFLEPHALDLSAYVGQTIRIAFLHDSDDDNLMAIDNILVASPLSLESYEFNDIIFAYPNPATDVINLSFSNIVKEQAIVTVYDATGRQVYTETFSGAQLGANHVLPVQNFATGLYSIQVQVDERGLTGSSFLKK